MDMAVLLSILFLFQKLLSTYSTNLFTCLVHFSFFSRIAGALAWTSISMTVILLFLFPIAVSAFITVTFRRWRLHKIYIMIMMYYFIKPNILQYLHTIWTFIIFIAKYYFANFSLDFITINLKLYISIHSIIQENNFYYT